MTKNKKNLEHLLENILSEDTPPPEAQNVQDVAPVEPAKDVSLDQVIDRYIIRYERESIPTSDTYEDELYGENTIPHYSKILNEVLKEQDEDEPLADDELDAGEDDLGLDLNTDLSQNDANEEPSNTSEEPVMATPRINLNDFARSIARLVNNYESLINIPDIILNRVEEYIKTNYNVRTAKELMDILDTNYSLKSLKKTEEDQEEVPASYIPGALSTEG